MFAIKIFNLLSMVKNSSQISDVFWQYPVSFLLTDVKVHESGEVKSALFYDERA